MPLSWAIFSFVTTVALAQAINYTSVEATAGKPVQLTYHASANKNCTPPRCQRFASPRPKAGVLIVRPTALTTTRSCGRPRINVPTQVAFYQAREGYTGPDHVSYDVTNADGEVSAFDVAIRVKAAAAPMTPGNGQKETSP